MRSSRIKNKVEMQVTGKKRKWIVTGLLSVAGAVDAAENPNIIFMLADDLGYGDLSCYNPEFQGDIPNNTPIATPHINSLATNGVRFTDFHSAAPICSPSRRALLTARYPSRLGEWAEGYASAPFGIEAAKEPTIGMWLKEAGYATACYGKWNIGNVAGVSWPGAHGFDDWLVIDHNTGYFQHQNNNADCHGQEMLFRTGGIRETSLRGKYLTDIFTDKALGFIEEKQNEPFFLYLPWSVPHTPLQSPGGDTNMAYNAGPAAGTPEGRAVYVEMVEYLDSRIGKIFQCLESNGLLDNTLILFTSDNGGNLAANNWPLKAGKQYLEEGGIRVPCLMQWPGALPSGEVCTQPAMMMDASVTLLSVADALQQVPTNRVLDGMDLLPVLQSGNAVTNRTFGWRRRDWGNTSNCLRQESYRKGDWKLLRTYDYSGDQQWAATYTDELFDLASDAGETTDLAATETNHFEELLAEYAAWKISTVDLDADFLVWSADQTGSPDQARLDAYLPTALNFSGRSYIPNPSPIVTGFDVYDYTWDDLMQGNLIIRDNEERVSDPAVSNGTMSIVIQPGCVFPFILLYRDGYIDTSRFQIMKIRLRISGAIEPTLTAEALLRHDGWAGEDIPFTVYPDGQWHEYAIDVTLSSAWDQWVRTGRIGLQFPHQFSQTITVEVDQMRVESLDGFHQLSLSSAGDGRFSLSYPSLVGRTYSLFFRESLATGAWSRISSGTAGSGENDFQQHTNTTAASGFYKLMEE
jgi:arylsulfatase A